MLKAITLIAALLVSKVSWALSYDMEITEAELQERITAMMPMEKKALFLKLVLSEPHVDLIKDTNLIGVTSNIAVSIPGVVGGKGKAGIQGSLEYNAEKGAFYLRNPKIVELDIDQLPEKYAPKVKQVAQVLVTNGLSTYPVYKFKEGNAQHDMAKAVLESVTVEEEVLHVKLSLF